MSRPERSPVRLVAGWAPRLAYGLLLGILSLAAVLLAAEADPGTRTSGLRLWALAGAAVFAMAPPNTLLPDPNVPVVQLLNWSPARLLRYQMRRMGPLVLLVVIPTFLIAFVDVDAPLRALDVKVVALGQAILILLGTALDSFVHFSTLGARSQAWQEGRAGHWYARGVEERGQGVSLPRGLVPALFATTRCFAIAIGVVVATAAAARLGFTMLAWGPGLVLLGWAVRRAARCRPVFDRHFYGTTAFYAEVLGGGTATVMDREPVPFAALYWVPSRWRPATWASLRQLDRLLPLGRLVAIAHVGLWLFCIRGIPPAFITTYLMLVLTAQVAASALLGTPAAAPGPFQISIQSVADWVGTRTFVNLRWFGAHVGSLGLVALFDDGYGLAWVVTWAAVHGALSLGAAAVVTMNAEGTARRSTA